MSLLNDSNIILLVILIVGIFSKNQSLSIASTVLILLKLLKLDFIFPKLEAYGLKTGLVILTIGILAPIAQGKYTIDNIVKALKSPIGIAALIGGVVVIIFTKEGYKLLTLQPYIVLPIIVGSILGVALFKGVPVGPLVSAGITFFIFGLYKFICRFF